MGFCFIRFNLILVYICCKSTVALMSVQLPIQIPANSSRDAEYTSYQIASEGSEFHNLTTRNSSEDGFELFFQSNEKEMFDIPIQFKWPLPDWLNGIFVRNGLGLFEKGPRSFLHAFDGFAKLASWKFMGNGTALFSTRFVRSMFYKSSMEANTITPYLLFQSVEPPFGYLETLQCLLRGIDNMNVNVYAFQNPKNEIVEYAAMSDFWIIYKINIQKLSTKHRVVPRIQKSRKSDISDLDSSGFLNLLSSSHPLPEPGTNNHLNFLSSVAILPWSSSVMNLMRIKSLKRRSIIAQWSVDRVPYMHSFSVTRTKAILLASPFYVNVMCMARKAEPFSCLDWYPEESATLYVVDLKSGNVSTITMNNIFSMHHVNAYELDNKNIIMDVSSYPSPDFVNHLQLHVLRDTVKRNSFAAHAQLKRIFIDMIKHEAYEIPIDLIPIHTPRLTSLLDMPVINEAYRSKYYCFVYGLVLKTDNKTLSKVAIVKKDMCYSGKGDRIWQVDGYYSVEPWFVAHPQAIEEDDGLLLVPVLHGAKRRTYLVILDAKTLTLVNKAVMPTNIPYSLHGRFFPAV